MFDWIQIPAFILLFLEITALRVKITQLSQQLKEQVTHNNNVS